MRFAYYHALRQFVLSFFHDDDFLEYKSPPIRIGAGQDSRPEKVKAYIIIIIIMACVNFVMHLTSLSLKSCVLLIFFLKIRLRI